MINIQFGKIMVMIIIKKVSGNVKYLIKIFEKHAQFD